MKILLTGANGQVGFELERSLQGLGEVVAPRRDQLDLTDLDQLREMIRRVKPDVIVNPAAYTAVDRAETEPALAFRVNAEAPGVMASEAARLGCAIVHYSTDYVFDGCKLGPYMETDPVNPINTYGRTKLAGEQAISDAGIAHLILRTSWVYGARGKNFMLTMQKLASERRELRVVADQRGAPTWSRTIADATTAILAQAKAGGAQWWSGSSGVYHLACQGETTWAGFAEAIIAADGADCKITPITTAEYPLPAQRPANSLLNCEKLRTTLCALPRWDDALALCHAGLR